MPKPKKNPTAPAPLVVVPPPPKVEKPGAVALSEQATRRTKRPLASRDNPGARDARGKATRTDVRRVAHRDTAPRANGNPPERSRQTRSHKAGKKKG